jgi:hypothetical protein
MRVSVETTETNVAITVYPINDLCRIHLWLELVQRQEVHIDVAIKITTHAYKTSYLPKKKIAPTFTYENK